MNDQIQYQLIRLYCYVSDEYYSTLQGEMQRLSNHCSPKFSDEEVMATYLWGLIQGQRTVKAVYSFIKTYYLPFFPKLPGYAEYNRHLNLLLPAFRLLLEQLLRKAEDLPFLEKDISIVDSFPIVVAQGKRSSRAKVAGECCAKGYCASKDMHYYGLKLHSLNFRRENAIPVPETFQITAANVHDLPAMKEVFRALDNRLIFADKAYLDSELKEELTQKNVWILTPHKKVKGEAEAVSQFLRAGRDLWSSAVSSVRQGIESFFNWLGEHFDLQHASKVRSSAGLYVFVLARLSAAIWSFFYS